MINLSYSAVSPNIGLIHNMKELSYFVSYHAHQTDSKVSYIIVFFSSFVKLNIIYDQIIDLHAQRIKIVG
jgi:hypothetical protein